MSSITEADRAFLSKVVQNAANDGLIPGSTSRGRDNPVNGGGCSPCSICCISGGRSENNEVALVISIALFALSALVGFFYTARSARSAMQAQASLSKARAITDITETVRSPSWQPSAPPMHHFPEQAYGAPPQHIYANYAQPQQGFQPQPAYAPTYGYVQPPHGQFQNPYADPFPYFPQPQPVYYPNYQSESAYRRTARQEVYDQAIIVLEGHRNERAFTACAQGVMTLGAALLTVALLISLIMEPEIETVYLGLAGGGLGFTGLVMWLGKHACLINEREQEAAQNILRMIRV